MTSRMIFSALRQALGQFCASAKGNVAITFGIMSLPLMMATGAAIDYNRGNSLKAAFQNALDSTALMLSKEAANDSAGQIQTNATKYFKALLNRPEATNVAVTVNYTSTNGSQITITGSATLPTKFMGILGVSSMDISASTVVRWGTTRLRVALVLDNTGSMSSAGKLVALKTATNNLLTQLKNAVTKDGDVYVSIIPFSKDVNLGSGNNQANWIDWTEWNAANGACSSLLYTSQSTCTSHGKTWTPANHATWNGCVNDRGGQSAPDAANYDTNVLAPTPGTKPSLFAAEQYSSCTQSVMGLNTNWTTMSVLTNSMLPAGNTNQAIGLAVGWMSLVGGGPFTVPAQDPNYKYTQVIVLLTDGLNTQDRWYTKQSSIDARQQLTCNNIKAAGITLYTIQVNTGNDPTSTLLRNCASSGDKFFLLTSADQIITAFNSIGTNLTRLFVAQ